MMNNLNILKEWLNSNGFKKEAIELNNLVVSSNVLYKSAWAGGPYTLGGATNLEEAKEWDRKNLGGGGPTLCDLNDSLILDALGVVPVYGDALDVGRSIEYVNCGKYFDALLTILASAPGIGAAVVIVKVGRKIKTVESLFSNIIVPVAKQIGSKVSAVITKFVDFVKYIIKWMKDNFEKTGMASSISKFADWSKETFITLAKMGEKPLTRGEIDDIILTTQRTEQAASAGARVARTVVRFASKKIFKDNEGRVFVAIASASGTKIFYKSTGKSIPGRAEKGIWTVMNGITLKSAQDGYWIFYIKDPGKILTPPLKKISDALTKMELDNGAIIANNAIEFGTVQRVTYRDLQNIAKFNNWVEEVGAITQAAKQTGMGLIGTSVGPTVRQAFADISTI